MVSKWWNAPSSTGPLDAKVILPGSKSETARALILKSRCAGDLKIHGALKARDTELMAAALQPGVTQVDCGLAGTVMRFVPALFAFRPQTAVFDGDESARTRPLAPLLDSLAALGATVDYLGEPGFLPFRLTGSTGPFPAEVKLDSALSSQFLSAMLLAVPAPLAIHLTGAIPSLPHVEMTAQMLRNQGVEVTNRSPRTWHVGGQPVNASPIHIQPDLSNAGPFLAAALICGGSVEVLDWPEATMQAGDAWRWILPHFGAQVERTDTGLRVTHDGSPWHGTDLNLGDVGELAPTVAALATLATTPSRLRGIGHLRGHETDRLEALATEINRAGASADITSDGLRITPGKLHAADFHSYEDHRMATFAACLSLSLGGSRIADIETTAKTLPDFTDRWKAMLDTGKPLPVEELQFG